MNSDVNYDPERIKLSITTGETGGKKPDNHGRMIKHLLLVATVMNFADPEGIKPSISTGGTGLTKWHFICRTYGTYCQF